jgi:hypothetical protein
MLFEIDTMRGTFGAVMRATSWIAILASYRAV